MASDKQKKQQKQNRTEEHQSTLTRLAKIPVVEFSIYLSLSTYSKVKSSSDLLNNVLNRVEKLGFVTLDSLRPLAGKFEKQIDYVDSMGNSLLDKVETTVPSVTSFQPKTVYANAANRVLSWKRYIVDQVNKVRNFNLNKTVSGGLKSVDNLVDEYLPGSEDEVVAVNNEVEDSLAGLTGQTMIYLANCEREVSKEYRIFND